MLPLMADSGTSEPLEATNLLRLRRVNPLKEYVVVDPMGGRSWNKSTRGGPAGRQMTLSVGPGRRASGSDQASDGPVDSWVDDMDGDGDWDGWQEIPVGGGRGSSPPEPAAP